MMPRRSCACPASATAIALILTGLVSLGSLFMGGCKVEMQKSCEPSSVKWGLQLALQASDTINPTDEGESLPTVVRVFQLKGDIAIEDLEFEALWKAEKADELGESFLSMEELTVFPEQSELRSMPVEPEATHVLAAALFRKPASNTWYTEYELPKNHADVVCAKAPDSKQYPDPCFFVRLDRNGLEGGATPPAGFEGSELQCAPLGVVLAPPEEDSKKKKRKERRKRRKGPDVPESDDLQKQLDGAADKVPETPKTPEVPKTPKAPELPKTPDMPKAPDLPSAPKAPKGPTLPKPR
jgi:type VI secretion system protein VasD